MFLKFPVFNIGFIVKRITRKVMVTEAATTVLECWFVHLPQGCGGKEGPFLFSCRMNLIETEDKILSG